MGLKIVIYIRNTYQTIHRFTCPWRIFEITSFLVWHSERTNF